MTKQELLKIMRLLSALESALRYTDRSSTPDFLCDEIASCAEILEREVLKP